MTFPILGSNNPPSSPTPTGVSNSLRFRSSASAYLNRTLGAPTNNKIWTYSSWCKRGIIGGWQQRLLEAYDGSSSASGYIAFDSNDTLIVNTIGSGQLSQSVAVFRDPSAWYHIVVSVNLTAATQKVYVNNQLVASTSVSNTASEINGPYTHFMGAGIGGYCDLYLADVNFIDGQSLSPTAFGAYDPTTGAWVPAAYSGTYGNNGFYLPFSSIGLTSGSNTGLGKDFSGNGNYWNTNNISVTAGATYDAMTDCPQPVDATHGNYPVLNPLDCQSAVTVSNANLTSTGTQPQNQAIRSTFGMNTGKWYFEATLISNAQFADIGIMEVNKDFHNYWTMVGNVPFGYSLTANGYTATNNTFINVGTTYSPGDVVGVIYDADLGNLAFYINGSFAVTAFTGLSGTYAFSVGMWGSTSWSVNFGQQPFQYTPPAGYSALQTFNLPDPAVKNGAYAMDAYLYTGNGTGQQVGQVSYDMAVYNLPGSLRWRSGATAYMTKTNATASSQTTMTFSFWTKGNFYTSECYFNANPNVSSDGFYISTGLNVNGDFGIGQISGGGSNRIRCTTVPLSRDSGEWYHVVIAIDTTQAVATDGIKIYVNGSLQTLTVSAYTQNTQLSWNSTLPQCIGRAVSNFGGAGSYFDGYMAEVNVIDGQQLTASSFGQFDGNGAWVPKQYTGTYGTNGFHLNFGNNSSVAALGTDTSGNNNNWTPSNFSLTAGSTYDWMQDVPAAQSATLANYAVMSPSDATPGVSTTDGNLGIVTTSGAPNSIIRDTIPITTKAYAEFTLLSSSGAAAFGPAIINSTVSLASNPSSLYYIFWVSNGIVYDPSALSGYASFGVGDVLGVAYDPVTMTVWFARNNVWISGDPNTGTGGFKSTYPTEFGTQQSFAWGDQTTGGAQTVAANFGQQPFVYTPPAGFNRLNTFNARPAGVENPNLVWIKSRSAATNNTLFDTNRGVGTYWSSNDTNAATTDANSLQQFNQDGFYVGSSSAVNNSGSTYVAWNWKAGNGTVTNTAGTITSTVNANPTNGFSIVSYTGNGGSATIGHGLGATPAFIIVRKLSGLIGATLSDSTIWHTSFPNSTYYMWLDSTMALQTTLTVWNSTLPTSSVFSVGANSLTNWNTDPYVAYCWAPVPGFSAFGKYTGNGSTNGPFIYTGFRPRWVMFKCSSNGGFNYDWFIFDTSRDPGNVCDNLLRADTNGTDAITPLINILSNGFNLINSDPTVNGSGFTYIYAAFAENPFKYANAR